MDQPVARHLQRAQRYIDEGQYAAASAVLEAQLQRSPDDADSLSLLLHTWLRRGRMRPATALARRLGELAPADAHAALRAAADLMRVDEFARARELLDLPLVRDSRDRAVLLRHAQLRARAGEYRAVLAVTERAAQLGTPGFDLLLLRARARDYCGDAGGAALDYAAAQDLCPDSGIAALGLAKVGAGRPEAAEARVAHLRRVLPAAAGGREEAALGYALFEELHALRHHAEAWDALQRAAAAAQRQWPYDAAGERARLDALLRTQQAQDTAATPAAAGAGADDLTPIFIVGLPRSGTSLLEAMLGRHTQVTAAGEHADFAYQLSWATDCDSVELLPLASIERSTDIDYPALGRAYLEHSRWRARGRSHCTDKLPSNVWLIGHIARALPHARIVHVARAPVDTGFAALRQYLGGAYPWSYAQQGIVDHYAHYRALMAHWQRVLPGRVLHVDYAEFADTEHLLRRVCAFCALPYQSQCLDASLGAEIVATPSSQQVREPVRPRMGAWQPYREYLGVLCDGLAAWPPF